MDQEDEAELEYERVYSDMVSLFVYFMHECIPYGMHIFDREEKEEGKAREPETSILRRFLLVWQNEKSNKTVIGLCREAYQDTTNPVSPEPIERKLRENVIKFKDWIENLLKKKDLVPEKDANNEIKLPRKENTDQYLSNAEKTFDEIWYEMSCGKKEDSGIFKALKGLDTIVKTYRIGHKESDEALYKYVNGLEDRQLRLVLRLIQKDFSGLALLCTTITDVLQGVEIKDSCKWKPYLLHLLSLANHLVPGIPLDHIQGAPLDILLRLVYALLKIKEGNGDIDELPVITPLNDVCTTKGSFPGRLVKCVIWAIVDYSIASGVAIDTVLEHPEKLRNAVILASESTTKNRRSGYGNNTTTIPEKTKKIEEAAVKLLNLLFVGVRKVKFPCGPDPEWAMLRYYAKLHSLDSLTKLPLLHQSLVQYSVTEAVKPVLSMLLGYEASYQDNPQCNYDPCASFPYDQHKGHQTQKFKTALIYKIFAETISMPDSPGAIHKRYASIRGFVQKAQLDVRLDELLDRMFVEGYHFQSYMISWMISHVICGVVDAGRLLPLRHIPLEADMEITVTFGDVMQELVKNTEHICTTWNLEFISEFCATGGNPSKRRKTT